MGEPCWSYKGLLPFFKKSEHHFDASADPQQHGFEGPMRYVSVSASDKERYYLLREPIQAAWTDLGVKHNLDTNNGCLARISKIEENWHNGLRQPSHRAYELNGVQVLTETRVHRVLFTTNGEGKHVASGIELADGIHIAVRKEIVLSPDAHRTPQLLMLSGIGPANELSNTTSPSSQTYHKSVETWSITLPSSNFGNSSTPHMALQWVLLFGPLLPTSRACPATGP